jgi:hypothetical protein
MLEIFSFAKTGRKELGIENWKAINFLVLNKNNINIYYPN